MPRSTGIEVRDVDINHSDLEGVLEPGTRDPNRIRRQHWDMRDYVRSTRAIRLGLNFIKGVSDDEANIIIARRGRGYDGVRYLWPLTGLSRRE